jgi:AcrR family transcriptional regulator
MDTPGIVRRAPFGSNPLVGERGTDTQRRILAAAMDVFGEVGFSAARVELITEKAGCSRPAFYQYFSSKDDVFWALAGDLGHEMVDLAERLDRVTPDAAGLARLRTWITEFMDLHEAHAPVFAGFQAASRDHQPQVRSSSGISERTGDALLRAFGVRASRRTSNVVTAMVAVLIRCSFYAEVMPGARDRERLVDGLAATLHRLFEGPIEGVNVDRAEPPRPSAPRPAAPPAARGAGTPAPRGAKTRQRLLDAGATVLPARGYHDTRVDDIVTAAGVSHGTFYRYFDNKDDFFRVLAEDAAGEMIDLLDRLRPDGDVDELRAWLQAWFDTYKSNGGVISTWQEMQTSAELASFSLEVAAAVITRLTDALDGRGFGDAGTDALTLLALIERVPYSVYTLGFTGEDDAVEAMATIIRRGFCALSDPG